jgi:DNA-binding beta-propeller fold protein YncE
MTRVSSIFKYLLNVEFNLVNNNIYAANIGSNTVSVVDSNSKVGDIIVIGNNQGVLNLIQQITISM